MNKKALRFRSVVTVSFVLGVVCMASNTSASSGSTSSGPGFVQPWGIAVDRAGNVYVTDSGANTIWRISAQG